MITEKHLLHILKEMDYTLVNIAREITKPEFPEEVFDQNGTHLSLKYLQEKTALLKFHIDWIRVDMEDDGV